VSLFFFAIDRGPVVRYNGLTEAMRNMSSKKKLATNILLVAIALALIAGFAFLFDPFHIFGRGGAPSDGESVRFPILMYHHFDDEGAPETIIPAEVFDDQIRALRDAGYTAISFDELCDYVFNGSPLPERPIMITIDDGYMSVYETAYPILKKYGMKATVFIIGVSHGKSLYKDTNYPIIPRFGDAEAVEMVESGVISIQSHSYDMHQHEPYETGPFRKGVLRIEGESEEEYVEAFRLDFGRAADQIEAMLGARPIAFSYPFGISNDMTDGLLREMGICVTLTIVKGLNKVTIGSPDSLLSLNRFNVPGDMTPEELLDMIAG